MREWSTAVNWGGRLTQSYMYLSKVTSFIVRMIMQNKNKSDKIDGEAILCRCIRRLRHLKHGAAVGLRHWVRHRVALLCNCEKDRLVLAHQRISRLIIFGRNTTSTLLNSSSRPLLWQAALSTRRMIFLFSIIIFLLRSFSQNERVHWSSRHCFVDCPWPI